jgi:hypothetical protein
MMGTEISAARANTMRPPHDIIANAFLTTVESDLLLAATLGGIHGVLAYLNARTRFRFTGIHPVTVGETGASNRRAYLYDRENPAIGGIDHCDLRRVTASVAHVEGTPEATNGQASDCFPAASCLGARLLAGDGTTWGMLCHFDHRLRTALPSEGALLQFLGARAGQWLDRQ